MTDFNDIMTMYPENLLNVIFGETDGRLRSCPAKGGYAADMDGMLAYLLETVLTERERTVIKLRFEDSKRLCRRGGQDTEDKELPPLRHKDGRKGGLTCDSSP